MSEVDRVPELRQILGALVFGAKRPLTIREMRRCLQDVAEECGGDAAVFAAVTNADIKAELASLDTELSGRYYGFGISEVAGGFRLQSDPNCGRWLKRMLSTDRPNRLSRPALETLSIIAYRQPIARSEIESVRGVTVDHVIKTLMEMQLVRIVGRSELPGRPLLYGTTHVFLEHFGLKSLKELSAMEPMLLVDSGRNDGRRKSAGHSDDESVMPDDSAEAESGPEDDADE